MIKKFFKKSPVLSKAKVRHLENMLSNLRTQKEHINDNIKEVELKLHNHHTAVLEQGKE